MHLPASCSPNPTEGHNRIASSKILDYKTVASMKVIIYHSMCRWDRTIDTSTVFLFVPGQSCMTAIGYDVGMSVCSANHGHCLVGKFCRGSNVDSETNSELKRVTTPHPQIALLL